MPQGPEVVFAYPPTGCVSGAGLTRQTAMQRLRSVAAADQIHADGHQAVIGPSERDTHEGQLKEVKRPHGPRMPVSAAPMTASCRPELALPTLGGRSLYALDDCFAHGPDLLGEPARGRRHPIDIGIGGTLCRSRDVVNLRKQVLDDGQLKLTFAL
jgi:hypothetical protein